MTEDEWLGHEPEEEVESAEHRAIREEADALTQLVRKSEDIRDRKVAAKAWKEGYEAAMGVVRDEQMIRERNPYE